MSKPKFGRANRLHLLDGQQRETLSKFQKDFQTALPAMNELAQTAKAMHEAMIHAPGWQIMENEKPDAPVQPPGMWSVGHAKVNYVDHIETEGAQDK